MFRDNQIVPAPDDDLIPEKQVLDFPTSQHGFDTNLDNFNRPDDGVGYYNNEFGGFSKRLTRETPFPLAPGTYTVKIVVQDVFDRKVDSAVFVESGSLKLFPLQQGDYNGDGCVDSADYDVWSANFNTSPATFYQGDGNGDCIVDASDYTMWRKNVGNSGNTDFRADFNRDGQVSSLDLSLFATYYNVLTRCASRFEGDADGDGDVDDGDFGILSAEHGSTSCDCDCGDSASSSESLAVLQQSLPESPDVDGDGDVDDADFAVLDAIVHGSDTEQVTTDDSEPAPALAESSEPTNDASPATAPQDDEQSVLGPAVPGDFPRR